MALRRFGREQLETCPVWSRPKGLTLYSGSAYEGNRKKHGFSSQSGRKGWPPGQRESRGLAVAVGRAGPDKGGVNLYT